MKDKNEIAKIFEVLKNTVYVKSSQSQKTLLEFQLNNPTYEGGYFNISGICTKEVSQWINGFCTGYLVGENYPQEELIK